MASITENLNNLYKLKSSKIKYFFKFSGLMTFISSSYMILLSKNTILKSNYIQKPLNTVYDNSLQFNITKNSQLNSYGYFNYTITDISSNKIINDVLINLDHQNGTSHILFPNDPNKFIIYDIINLKNIYSNVTTIITNPQTGFPLIHTLSSMIDIEGLKFNALLDSNIFFFDSFLMPVETIWTTQDNRHFLIEGLFNFPKYALNIDDVQNLNNILIEEFKTF